MALILPENNDHNAGYLFKERFITDHYGVTIDGYLERMYACPDGDLPAPGCCVDVICCGLLRISTLFAFLLSGIGGQNELISWPSILLKNNEHNAGCLLKIRMIAD